MTISIGQGLTAGVGVGAAVVGGTANSVLFVGSGRTLAQSANLTFDGTTFSSAGNTTLGDASSDTLTINAGTWTIGSNFNASRSAGVAASGISSLGQLSFSASGNADGTSDVRALVIATTISGANAFTQVLGQFNYVVHSGSNTVSTLHNLHSGVMITSTGSISNTSVYRAQFTLTSSGGVTGSARGLLVASPSFSGTGTIANLIAVDIANQGHATLVTNAVGVNIADFTASVTSARGIRSRLSSGTNKHNLYIDGTADNYFAGNVGIGIATPSVPLDVAGTVKVHRSTAIPAGGTTGAGLLFSSTANFGIFFGSGAPTLSAAKGSLYLRSDGTTTNDRIYVNTDGGTTWTAITTAS